MLFRAIIAPRPPPGGGRPSLKIMRYPRRADLNNWVRTGPKRAWVVEHFNRLCYYRASRLKTRRGGGAAFEEYIWLSSPKH